MIIKHIKLNDNLLTPDGRTESFNYNIIENTDRTASGKMKKQIIAKKVILSIEYELISKEDLQVIYDIYEADEFVSVILEDYESGTKTFTANLSGMDFEKDFYGADGNWYLKGLTFELEEV